MKYLNHELKIEPPYFDAVIRGFKTFEIRNDDRGFAAGDRVTLRAFCPRDGFTGESVEMRIGFVSRFAQKSGMVVFSILPIDGIDGAECKPEEAERGDS